MWGNWSRCRLLLKSTRTERFERMIVNVLLLFLSLLLGERDIFVPIALRLMTDVELAPDEVVVFEDHSFRALYRDDVDCRYTEPFQVQHVEIRHYGIRPEVSFDNNLMQKEKSDFVCSVSRAYFHNRYRLLLRSMINQWDFVYRFDNENIDYDRSKTFGRVWWRTAEKKITDMFRCSSLFYSVD